MENDKDNLLGSLGYVFPQNSQQLENFKTIYSEFNFEANEAVVNPKRILKRIENDNAEVTQVDYHKRLTLAAEIVYQLHDDHYMGHLKLEKMLYLCQNVANISIYVNFLKQAMGPYDPVMMRSLDKRFEMNRWFKYNFTSFPKYSALEKVGEHRLWYNRYYQDHLDDINSLISTFRIFNGDQIELVVTIFECWKELIEDEMDFSIGLIKKKVYAWSENKKKFKEKQIENAVSWMEEKGIFPNS